MSVSVTKPHYLTLDTFRGLCACLVALSHFNAVSIFSNHPLLDRGSIYVDFFFVLSGFVIFANYGDRLQEGYSIGKFVLLRFGRLYPLHFCVLMAFVGIDLLQMVIPAGDLAVYKPFSAPGEGIKDIIANLLLVHSLHVSKDLAFNGPSWSISTEFYTYILFAFVLAYAGKYYKYVVSFLGASCAVILYLIYGELFAKLDYGFLRCVYGFACGALTYELFRTANPVEKMAQDKKRANILEFLVFAAVLIYIALFSEGASSIIAPLVFSLVVLVFAYEGGFLSEILKTRVFVFLGLLSYSIYMNHMFISGKFFALGARLLEIKTGIALTTPGPGGFPVFGHDLLSGTLFEIFYLLVVIGCSWISFKLIEEPCRNYTRKLAASKK